MVPKGGCSVTLITNTAEGALCVPALPISAKMLVLAFINIYKQERKSNCRNGALKILLVIHAKEVYQLSWLILTEIRVFIMWIKLSSSEVINPLVGKNPDAFKILINVFRTCTYLSRCSLMSSKHFAVICKLPLDFLDFLHRFYYDTLSLKARRPITV